MGVKSAPGEVLSTEIGPSTPPRVVVGVPPSDPPPSSEVDSSDLPETIQVEGVPRAPDVIGLTPTVPSVTEKPPAPAPPPPADVKADFAKTFVDAPKPIVEDAPPPAAKKNDEDKDEKTKMFASPGWNPDGSKPPTEIAFGSSVKVEEPAPAPEPKKKFAQTLAFGSALVDPPASATPDTQASPALAAAAAATAATPAPAPAPEPARLDTTLKMDQAPASHPGRKIDEKPLEAKKVETKPVEVKKVDAAKAESKADAKAEKPTSDSKGTSDGSSKKKKSGSSSGTDHHHHDDVISEKFFSEGSLARHQVVDVTENDALTIPDKAKRKSEPAVVQRRQRFVRYVTWAVGVAAVLCLAAVLRTTMQKPSANASAKNVVATAAAAPAPEPKAAEPAVTAAVASGAEAPPTPAGDPSAAPAASGDPAAAGSAAAAAPEEKKEEVTGDPKEEKAKMRKLLETRKLDEAIEAGEKSVALDPTDGEAWLILGATYQEKGKLADARRCYTACIKEGKTGPRHECGKMLR